MHQFGHIVLAVVFPSSVVFNSPKASEASKKTLNYLFAILQWGGGARSSFGLLLGNLWPSFMAIAVEAPRHGSCLW
jgi:hypothetical protein